MASDSQQNIDGVMAINQAPRGKAEFYSVACAPGGSVSPCCEMDDWAQFDKINSALENDGLSSRP
jgi:hypothetical protein